MMKSILPRFVTLACLLTFLTPNIASSAQERRIALIIGNGAYKSSYLKNPANDANDIAEALKESQFTITKLINADRRKMESAIRHFGNSLERGDVGLFYFAGHGVQVNGRNYLIPIGSTIETESDVEFEAVDAGRVLGKMQDAGNKINIMILDACRNNPYGSQFRSAKRGLAVIPAPKGALVAYSTSPGSESEDGVGRNGLYTSMLLKYIREQELTVERFFKKTGRDVSIASNYKQVPWIQSSLIEDFYFSPQKGATVVKRPSVEPNKPKTETPNYASISPNVTEPKSTARIERTVPPALPVLPAQITTTPRNERLNCGKIWISYDSAGQSKARRIRKILQPLADVDVPSKPQNVPDKNSGKVYYSAGAGTQAAAERICELLSHIVRLEINSTMWGEGNKDISIWIPKD